MSFESEANHWEEFITYLHRLSDSRWTGRFFVRMEEGRITRGTMEYLNDRVALVTQADHLGVTIPQQEDADGKG